MHFVCYRFVECCPLKEAFEKDARFFVLNPPLDENNKSTRYLVLQRALASIGVCFKYNKAAVSCEAFAMTMMNVEPDWSSSQLKVIKSHAKKPDEDKLEEHDGKFKVFYKHILNRWDKLDQPVILTLDYFLKKYGELDFNPLADLDRLKKLEPKLTLIQILVQLNQQDPWFLKMIEDYNEFFGYVREGNRKEAEELWNENLGLNVNSGFMVDNEKVTALELLKKEILLEKKLEGNPEKYEEMYKWLQNLAGLEQD